MRSNRALKQWYREINTRFFDSELPDNVCVKWAEEDDLAEENCEAGKYFGWADLCDDGYHKYKIIIDPELGQPWAARISTLVHEMIHVATELRDDHGPAFEKWRQLVSDRGIFKKNTLRKGLTLF